MTSGHRSPNGSIRSYGSTDDDNSQSSKSSVAVHGTDYHNDQHHPEPSSDRARRKSFIEEDEDELQIEPPTKKKEETVTWSSLPCKSQLAILTMARLSEPLVQTSLRVRSHISSSAQC